MASHYRIKLPWPVSPYLIWFLSLSPTFFPTTQCLFYSVRGMLVFWSSSMASSLWPQDLYICFSFRLEHYFPDFLMAHFLISFRSLFNVTSLKRPSLTTLINPPPFLHYCLLIYILYQLPFFFPTTLYALHEIMDFFISVSLEPSMGAYQHIVGAQ